MRVWSRAGAVAVAIAVVAAVAGCQNNGGANANPKVLTYWASQQSPSVERDKEILKPELRKFTERTGIRVNLEVIPFTDLLNRILTATTSGKGPDVINLGNSWAPSLQATGALVEWDDAMMARLGGAKRFTPVSLQTGGAEGTTPTSVPLYSKVYQLYYNKKLFERAGITKPPATWKDFVTTARKLTKDTDGDGRTDQWGLGVRGQAGTIAVHYAYILGSARGAEFFAGDKPAFDSPAAVKGIEQYLSWMGKDKIVNPSDAENADWADVYEAFAEDHIGMMLVQTLGQTLKDYHLTDEDYGVAPMPAATGPGSKNVGSFLGGTNAAILKSTDNLDGATELIKFLTGPQEQVTLNAAYGTIPPVKDAKGKAFETEEAKIARQTMATRAIPLPRVPQETQFETLIGNAVVNWLSDTATGKQPGGEQISSALKDASAKVSAGG
ncbi:ABC transporter substrate-binding protein [Streptomyces africanus]|uniref:ABC transporter substrate-binding protein n=1 Tax=Streptomyces africanus TaxID=231024 RepID=UPI001302B315|nr:sugar ABC transporter substrate-binding protein [Streptomyces africanus]